MRAIFVVLALFIAAPAFAADGVAPPAWFLDEIKSLTSGGGRWIADNAAYKSKDEPYEAYGVEWRSGFDGATMTGRLFGLKGGAEVGPFWEFRQYWSPGDGVAILEQFGWGGAIGRGRLTQDANGQTIADQEFTAPGRPARREGHKSRFADEVTHTTESFDIVDGVWTARRRYEWKLTAPAGK
jgi:hypothetical protein